MELTRTQIGFQLFSGSGQLLLRHSEDAPMLFAGTGKETVSMYRGNFQIDDQLESRRALPLRTVTEEDGGLLLDFDRVTARLTIEGEVCTLTFTSRDPEINRFWLRVPALHGEKVYGCGEQMSYLNLRGRNFPIWTSEPGVGRDPTSAFTQAYTAECLGGGDYYNTNFPQPTFVSSKHYYLHVDSCAYADFNFHNKDFHELEIWEVPAGIRIEAAENYVELLEKLTAYFGRQPELPDWVYNGLILGLQGGAQRVLSLLERTRKHDIPVSALWCQDWCGKRVTSFGKRLQWDWHYHEEMYPGLPGLIEDLKQQGIRFMNYLNPYLVEGGMLFNEGAEKGYFAKRHDGSVYLVDFGEFNCGAVDLTNPEAFEWFKQVIIRYSIDIGMAGWMADFGEYQPVDDIVFYSGESPMTAHNRWPALWAKCCYEALEATGNLGKIVYFMRAGGVGSQKYCTLLWAGDQSVDFSRHDGLRTTITAALSAGMVGCGLNHSDIGGYTSMYEIIRTEELFLRWAEMSMLTPVMRTHEGNRPETNFQYYESEECMDRLSRLVKIYTALAPYTKSVVKENAERGLPAMRPLFLHYEDDPRTHTIQYQYLLGRDVLVAPVYSANVKRWLVYLPHDNWIHLWTGAEYGGGDRYVDAPLGYPPVFYRKNSAFAPLFEEIGRKWGM